MYRVDQKGSLKVPPFDKIEQSELDRKWADLILSEDIQKIHFLFTELK